MPWFHFNPVAVYAGPGVRLHLSHHLSGKTSLLVTTEGMVRRGVAKTIMDLCPAMAWRVQTVLPNPDLDVLDAAAAALREENFDTVVALGGGSAMDSAKAFAAILPMREAAPLARWLRRGEERGNAPVLPLICLPTTAGTGAEVTSFGTIWDTAEKKKRSIAHQKLFPQTALLDPELLLTLPWRETLFGAMDTVSHSLETLWNKNATPVSVALAAEALSVVMAALPQTEKDPQDIVARGALQSAAVLAGIAISQSRTALAHAMSYPITLAFDVPHGLACAFTLPAIVRRVSAEGVWGNDRIRGLAEQAASFISGYTLKTFIREYCAPEEVYACLNGMFEPSRFDNFVVILSRDAVSDILHESLET